MFGAIRARQRRLVVPHASAVLSRPFRGVGTEDGRRRYELLDVGTGITDAQGALVSSAAGIPSFIGVLHKSVVAILASMSASLCDGDVFITNDPNHGGVTHLNDVVVAEPVFVKEACVAWVASIAHWGDVGGRTPGSMPPP